MVVLSSFTQPTDGVRHTQKNTTVFVSDNNIGKGTLFIAESQLSWVSDTGNGFALDYPHISLHAISRDLNSFPQECLFLMLDTNLDDCENYEDGDGNNESEEDDQGGTIMILVPDDKGMLDAMFHAMNACQALHPDPDDSSKSGMSDEDSFEDAFDEVPMEEADFQMAGLTIGNTDEMARGYMSSEWVGRGLMNSENCHLNYHSNYRLGEGPGQGEEGRELEREGEEGVEEEDSNKEDIWDID